VVASYRLLLLSWMLVGVVEAGVTDDDS